MSIKIASKLVIFRVYFVQRGHDQCQLYIAKFSSSKIKYFRFLFIAKISELRDLNDTK